jgi:hypothetical protein
VAAGALKLKELQTQLIIETAQQKYFIDTACLIAFIRKACPERSPASSHSQIYPRA